VRGQAVVQQRRCMEAHYWQSVDGRQKPKGKQPNVAIDAESFTSATRERTRGRGNIVSIEADVRECWLMVGDERLMSTDVGT
jgi:hypothetical protein